MDYLLPLANGAFLLLLTALVKMGKDSLDQVRAELVLVRGEVGLVRGEIGQVRSEVGQMRSDLTQVALAVGAKPRRA